MLSSCLKSPHQNASIQRCITLYHTVCVMSCVVSLHWRTLKYTVLKHMPYSFQSSHLPPPSTLSFNPPSSSLPLFHSSTLLLSLSPCQRTSPNRVMRLLLPHLGNHAGHTHVPAVDLRKPRAAHRRRDWYGGVEVGEVPERALDDAAVLEVAHE